MGMGSASGRGSYHFKCVVAVCEYAISKLARARGAGSAVSTTGCVCTVPLRGLSLRTQRARYTRRSGTHSAELSQRRERAARRSLPVSRERPVPRDTAPHAHPRPTARAVSTHHTPHATTETAHTAEEKRNHIHTLHVFCLEYIDIYTFIVYILFFQRVGVYPMHTTITPRIVREVHTATTNVERP